MCSKIKKFNEFNSCDCGCGECDKNENKILTNKPMTESLKYHLENNDILTESVFRYGSKSYFELINEAREQYLLGNLELSEINKEIIETDIGKKANYEGSEVWLDIPFTEGQINEVMYRGKKVKTSKPRRASGASKPYMVYVSGCNEKTDSNPSGVKLVRFGSGDLRAKIDDPDARRRYDKRHGCSEGKHNDKCKPGYWSCRLTRFSKNLGLSGGGQWW